MIRAVIRQQERHEQQRGERGRDGKGASRRDESIPEPIARPRENAGDDREEREDEQIDGGRRLQDAPHRESSRVPGRWLCKKRVERQQRQRQKFCVLRLQVGKTCEHMRVEREDHAGDDAGTPVSGPASDDETHGPASQSESGH